MSARTILKMIVGLALIWLTGTEPAAASDRAGGEDFPFFCSLGDRHGREAFKVQHDDNSNTGWVMIFYVDYKAEWWMPVSVSRNEENKVVVYGRMRERILTDRAFLGVLATEENVASEAETRSLMRWQNDQYWSLRAAYCRPAAPLR